MTRRNMRHYASPAIGLGVVCATLAGLLGLHAKSQTAVKRETATSRSIPVVEAQVLGGKLNEGSQNDEEGDASSRGSWAAVSSCVNDTKEQEAFKEAVTNLKMIVCSIIAQRLGIDEGKMKGIPCALSEADIKSDKELMANLNLTEEQKAIAMDSNMVRSCTDKLPWGLVFQVQSFDEYAKEKLGDTNSMADNIAESSDSVDAESGKVTLSEREKVRQDLKVSFQMRNACGAMEWDSILGKVDIRGVRTKFLETSEGVVYSQKNRPFFYFTMSALPFTLEELVHGYAYRASDRDYHFPAERTFPKLIKKSRNPVPFVYVEGSKGSYTVIRHQPNAWMCFNRLSIRTRKYEFPDVSTKENLKLLVELLRQDAQILESNKLVVGMFETPDVTRPGGSKCLLMSDSLVFDELKDSSADDLLVGTKLDEIGDDSKEIGDFRCIFVNEKYFEIVLTKFKASLALLQGSQLFDYDFKARNQNIVDTLVDEAELKQPVKKNCISRLLCR